MVSMAEEMHKMGLHKCHPDKNDSGKRDSNLSYRNRNLITLLPKSLLYFYPHIFSFTNLTGFCAKALAQVKGRVKILFTTPKRDPC